MPTYEYWCVKCERSFEAEKRMSAPHPTHCPLCNSKKIRREFTAPNIPSIGKSKAPSPAVTERLQPTGSLHGIPFYSDRNEGLSAVSLSHGPEGSRFIAHPNLAGPPPGKSMSDGRILVTKKDKKEK